VPYRFDTILSREGEDVTWHKRSWGATPDPETGDLPVSWATETVKAVVQPASVSEAPIEAGYSLEDYVRIFCLADIQQGDRITHQGITYEVLAPQAFYFRGMLEYRTALARRLIV